MSTPNRPNRPSAFTLAEMIIVMGILAVMGTIGYRTYFTERDRFEFNNSLTKTMQMFKTVRNYATTSYPVYIKQLGKNIIPLDGYGIQFNFDKVLRQLTLTIFANVGPGPDLANYQKDDDPNAFNTAGNSDIVLETYTLPKQIDFRYFYFKKEGALEEKKWKIKTTTDPAGPTATQATLVFKPPLGDMTIVDDLFSVLERLSLEFQNPAADGAGPKKCQRIIINRIKGFPELMYESTCS
jgi:prepilin-type N-terminal cleavage/methylation domain-containing protein